MAKKKTTLMLDESAYTRARKLAAEQGVSISQVVCEALAKYEPAGERKPIKLTTFGDPSERPQSGEPINYMRLADELEAEYYMSKQNQ